MRETSYLFGCYIRKRWQGKGVRTRALRAHSIQDSDDTPTIERRGYKYPAHSEPVRIDVNDQGEMGRGTGRSRGAEETLQLPALFKSFVTESQGIH